jgi:hypothetical protein
MFFRRPGLTLGTESPSYALLQDALAQYDVSLGDDDDQRELQSLNMDDIDFVEAIELVERALHSKIDRTALGPSTTIAEVVAMFNASRNAGQG